MTRPGTWVRRATGAGALLLLLSAAGGPAAAGAPLARPLPQVTVSPSGPVTVGQVIVLQLQGGSRASVRVSWGDGRSSVRSPSCATRAAAARPVLCKATARHLYEAPGTYTLVARQSGRIVATRTVQVEAVQAPPAPEPTPAATGPTPSPEVVPQPWQTQMLERLNAQRARVGAAPVTLCARLMTSAQKHTDDMHTRLYYKHVSPEGTTPTQRAQLEGYLGNVGENLSLNPIGGHDLVDDVWANSPGHYANMIEPAWTHVGFGYTEDEYNAFFAQVFGEGGVC